MPTVNWSEDFPILKRVTNQPRRKAASFNSASSLFSSNTDINPNTGRIINPGDFGRIISTSNNPRLIQFALKLNF
jgi:hypothetical protein